MNLLVSHHLVFSLPPYGSESFGTSYLNPKFFHFEKRDLIGICGNSVDRFDSESLKKE